ncbi:MAG: septal ring lytic transglycosylase RlpA family protein [Gammaproteobacteria bacterium]
MRKSFVMPRNRRRCAPPRGSRAFIALAVAALLSGCGQAYRWSSPAPEKQATNSPSTKPAKKSKRGNPPFYEVYGVRYHVMDSAAGYTERGVASWYGKKFHGRPTSSGVIYDMYKMTAAHKALPLPTTVRVTHLGNGKSIVVTVNDRGPFVHNRIIDLSYAAARELDMIGSGTAMVEVEALSGPGLEPVRTAASVPLMTDIESAEVRPAAAAAAPQPSPSQFSSSSSSREAPRLYLQVGAFGDPVNARELQTRLEIKGLSNAVIRYDLNTSPTLYRVRLGPIGDVAEYDALVDLMASMQIVETHLVTETGDLQTLDVATSATGVRPPGGAASGG